VHDLITVNGAFESPAPEAWLVFDEDSTDAGVRVPFTDDITWDDAVRTADEAGFDDLLEVALTRLSEHRPYEGWSFPMLAPCHPRRPRAVPREGMAGIAVVIEQLRRSLPVVLIWIGTGEGGDERDRSARPRRTAEGPHPVDAETSLHHHRARQTFSDQGPRIDAVSP
jgi:hypothetical protein